MGSELDLEAKVHYPGHFMNMDFYSCLLVGFWFLWNNADDDARRLRRSDGKLESSEVLFV